MNALLSARRVARAWKLSTLLAALALLLGQLLTAPGLAQTTDEEQPVKVTARLVAAAGDEPVKLEITAIIEEGYHTYSITQPKGKGPRPTELKIDESPLFKLGEWKAEPAPKKVFDDLFKAEIEEHLNKVVWSAPITLAEGAKLEDLAAAGQVKYLVCDAKSCLPGTAKFTAKLAAEKAPAPSGEASSPAPTLRPGLNIAAPFNLTPSPAPSAFAAVEPATSTAAPAAAPTATSAGVAEYRPNGSKTALVGQATPQQVRAGETIKLTIFAAPDHEYHVYSLDPKDLGESYQSTLLVLTDAAGFTPVKTTSNLPVEEHDLSGQSLRYYDGTVAWTIELSVPADAAPGAHTIRGAIGYQACSGANCDAPRGAPFNVTVNVGDAGAPGAAPVTFEKSMSYGKVAALLDTAVYNAGTGPIAVTAAPEAAPVMAPTRNTDAATVNAEVPAVPAPGNIAPSGVPVVVPLARGALQVKDVSGLALDGLPTILLAALLGGFILNFMPCVLPVIGLKIMSFVAQAGENRSRIFLLNVAYTFGVLSVFMVLATLAAFLNYSWGQQFTNMWFTIGLACLIWVMALSFMGIWELPIPGLSGGGSHDLARKEGYVGAFFKGIVATLLATPCSGPFIGAVLGATLRMTPGEIYLVFGAVGVGMASPYLALGCFPSLIKLLPKPGAWMDTFKQAMGFLLMGGVVFLLNSLPVVYIIPTFTLLIGLWAAVWWIGRTDPLADFQTTARAWMVGATVVLLVSAGAFGLMLPGEELPWEPYTKETLAKYQAEGKTVLVDFTADWCNNCKAIEKFVLNTRTTNKVVRDNGVKTLVADWTEEAPEITEMLHALDSRSIPVTAIFPAGKPNAPIVLRDVYFQQALIDALTEAGPSQNSVSPQAPSPEEKSSVPVTAAVPVMR